MGDFICACIAVRAWEPISTNLCFDCYIQQWKHENFNRQRNDYSAWNVRKDIVPILIECLKFVLKLLRLMHWIFISPEIFSEEIKSEAVSLEQYWYFFRILATFDSQVLNSVRVFYPQCHGKIVFVWNLWRNFQIIPFAACCYHLLCWCCCCKC